jgi:hypothetical protein
MAYFHARATTSPSNWRSCHGDTHAYAYYDTT